MGKHKRATLGQIEAVFNRLGGVEGAKRFLSKFWHLWHEVTVSEARNICDAIDFHCVLRTNRICFDIAADDVIRGLYFHRTEERKASHIILTSPQELFGGDDTGPSSREEIYEGAFMLGLDEIPAYSLFSLIMNMDQKNRSNRWFKTIFHIAVKPVRCSDGHGQDNVLVLIFDEKGKMHLSADDGRTSSSFAAPSCDKWFFQTLQRE